MNPFGLLHSQGKKRNFGRKTAAALTPMLQLASTVLGVVTYTFVSRHLSSFFRI